MEAPRCVYCQQPVVLEQERYLVVNKDQPQRESWIFAHEACARDQSEGPPRSGVETGDA